jgi:hypothetical protein
LQWYWNAPFLSNFTGFELSWGSTGGDRLVTSCLWGDCRHYGFSAKQNPTHTRFTLPAVRVNSVLAKKYTTSSPVKLTREMVWDMELQKAWDPKTFIPYVVSEAKSWGRHRLHDGSERFFRSSEQLGWITGQRGTVLEEVLIDHVGQRILFFGRETLQIDGDRLRHVEHAAGGSVDDPLNLWRIVILTPEWDERYTEPFKEMARGGLLPGFLEIYIERKFHCDLKSRAA